jgi:hypothetical protein
LRFSFLTFENVLRFALRSGIWGGGAGFRQAAEIQFERLERHSSCRNIFFLVGGFSLPIPRPLSLSLDLQLITMLAVLVESLPFLNRIFPSQRIRAVVDPSYEDTFPFLLRDTADTLAT